MSTGLKEKYSVVIPSRGLESESSLYHDTLQSLLNQDTKPENIFFCVYYKCDLQTLESGINYLYNFGKDIHEPMAGIPLINDGITQVPLDNHIVISGDDCNYPKDYFSILLEEINNNPTIGIISGNKKEKGRIELERVTIPSGSGRLYNKKLRNHIFPHPYANYGESLFLYQSEMLGMKNYVSQKTYFNHNRKTMNLSLSSSGLCSYELGYPLWTTLARFTIWGITERQLRFSFVKSHISGIIHRKPRAPVNILLYVKKSNRKKQWRLVYNLAKSIT